MCDITNFERAEAHPGGPNILEGVEGREIGQFLNGSHSTMWREDPTGKVYPVVSYHSLYAYECIGRLAQYKVEMCQDIVVHRRTYRDLFQQELP